MRLFPRIPVDVLRFFSCRSYCVCFTSVCFSLAALLPIAKAAKAPTTVINAVASKTYGFAFATALNKAWAIVARSEERRVGKEC